MKCVVVLLTGNQNVNCVRGLPSSLTEHRLGYIHSHQTALISVHVHQTFLHSWSLVYTKQHIHQALFTLVKHSHQAQFTPKYVHQALFTLIKHTHQTLLTRRFDCKPGFTLPLLTAHSPWSKRNAGCDLGLGLCVSGLELWSWLKRSPVHCWQNARTAFTPKTQIACIGHNAWAGAHRGRSDIRPSCNRISNRQKLNSPRG